MSAKVLSTVSSGTSAGEDQQPSTFTPESKGHKAVRWALSFSLAFGVGVFARDLVDGNTAAGLMHAAVMVPAWLMMKHMGGSPLFDKSQSAEPEFGSRVQARRDAVEPAQNSPRGPSL